MAKEFFIFFDNEKFGFKNFNKNISLENTYDDVKEFEGHIAWVKKENLWNLIDITGKNIIKEKYDDVLFFDQYYSITKKNKTFFIIDNQYKKISKIKYEFINFENNIITVKDEKNNFFYLKNNLEPINNEKYDNAIHFVDGFAPVCKKSKWGIINKNGVQIVDFFYDKIFQNGENLFKVQNNNEIFFIDLHNNKYLQNLSSKIETTDYFSNELLIIKKNDKYGVMNEFFEILFFKKVDFIFPFTNDETIYKKDNKYGLLSKKGKFITSNIFDEILWKSSSYYFVKRDGKYNYYSLDDKKLFY